MGHQNKTEAKPLLRRLDLFAPVDIASLVYYRVAFGLLLLWTITLYFLGCKIEGRWIGVAHHFKYLGFSWVQAWPGDGMYIHFAVLGVLAFFVVIGFCYRASMALFCIGYTQAFLIDSTYYLNHGYLICLLSFIMVFVPAHRAFSVDAWRRKSSSSTAPAWTLGLLRAQMGIVYFFGGIAKINSDWLSGNPMRYWLQPHEAMGPLFTGEWGVALFGYGGMFLDLLVVPLLLWRRTRLLAFVIAGAFHLTNRWLFPPIALFPWLAIATTALFFPPDWPRRLIRWLRPTAPVIEAAATEAVPLVVSPRERRAVKLFLSVYFAVQIFLPLRHWLYPGDASWTEEGHIFAWRMMLRSKTGTCTFLLRDPVSGQEWQVDPDKTLKRKQAKEMRANPDMILQYAHILADEARAAGHDRIEVRVNAMASMNGRKPQPLIDAAVDLAREPRTWRHYAWIMPVAEPLPGGD